MSGGDESCPPREELERAALEGCPESLERHMETCEACARVFGEILEEATLIADIARAVNDADAEPARDSEVVEGYTLLEEIHRGGQGVVWKAVQHDTNRVVALKALHAGLFAGEAERARFQREIELVARLRHPGIVTVYGSIASATGQRWIAMEYIDGKRLDDWSRSRWGESPDWTPETAREYAKLFASICDAVAHAQRRGVIHRDLKPSNVLVDAEGSPRVLDFGIARESEGVGDQVTRADEFVGTYAYAAPEQFDAERGGIGTWTDVYAISVMAYEVLTGTRPHAWEGSLPEFVRRVCEETPARPRSVNPGVTRDLEVIVLRGLASDPARRYQSAAYLRDEFERFATGEPIMARRDHSLYVLSRVARKYKWRVATGALAISLVLIALPLVTFLAIKASNEASRKEAQLRFVLDQFAAMDVETSNTPIRTLPEYLERVASGIESELGEYPELRAPIESALALAHLDQSQYDDALKHMHRALELRESMHKGRHPSIARSHHDLGRIYWKAARYVEARTHYEEALRLYERIHGSDHTRTLETKQQYASTLTFLNEFETAERLLREVLETSRTSYGEDDPRTALAWFTLGRFYQEQGEGVESVRCLRKALRMIEAEAGVDDFRTGRAAHYLAMSLIENGRLIPASSMIERALRNKRLNFGTGDREYAVTDLLRVEIALRDPSSDGASLERAEAIARGALAVIESSYDGAQPETARAHLMLGRVLMRRGDVSSAEGHLGRALAIRERVLHNGAWPIGEAHFFLGECAAHLGRAAEASRHFAEAARILSATRHAEDWLRRRAEAAISSMGGRGQLD